MEARGVVVVSHFCIVGFLNLVKKLLKVFFMWQLQVVFVQFENLAHDNLTELEIFDNVLLAVLDKLAIDAVLVVDLVLIIYCGSLVPDVNHLTELVKWIVLHLTSRL